MKKGREIKHLPVIDLFGGQYLGYVHDFKTAGYDKLQGLYIVSPENDVYYLPLEAISKLGNDAVLVKSELLKVSTGQTEWGEELTERAVLTSSGELLGQVADLLIERKEGYIYGYEVTDGYLKDIFWGRKVIATTDILTWGKDTVIIKER